MIRQLPSGSARAAYDHFETIAEEQSVAQCVAERMRQEALSWPYSLEDYRHEPPFCKRTARTNSTRPWSTL
jgi:hypothetical protein